MIQVNKKAYLSSESASVSNFTFDSKRSQNLHRLSPISSRSGRREDDQEVSAVEQELHHRRGEGRRRLDRQKDGHPRLGRRHVVAGAAKRIPISDEPEEESRHRSADVRIDDVLQRRRGILSDADTDDNDCKDFRAAT